MMTSSRRFPKAVLRTAAMLSGLMVAACVAPQSSSPQQVQQTNPSVTYKYRSDQELIQANQNASTFCNRYQSVPRTANFTNDPDGSKVVVFECVTNTAAVPMPQVNPNLTYTYRSDQELLNSSRNAQVYCTNNGSQQVMSNIVTNADGTRTVTYQCGPR